MPDIEKLRGLLEKWRKRESESHMQMPLSVSDEAQSCCCRFCANELEAVGLAELLADYERLLRERPAKTTLQLVQPDEMISWLNELNSNWAVCRNTRAFLQGQPVEYWKNFDAAMGKAFELQIALMKLVNDKVEQPPAVSEDPSAS